jgi:D-galactonate transporter
MNPIYAQPGPAVRYSERDKALFSKVSWHLLPLLIICYGIAFLDRINIGYAQLQMKQTLPFSDTAYAFGAGIFFIGYFLFEVPSNLLLEKIGARKTLLRIMLLWGLTASAMMFVQTTMQFYVLRFLLGAFEAGFFPGIILYLTYWYPSARRAKVISIFMTATSIAHLIAGPLSGSIMKYMDGVLGHYGWQWLYVVQGLPASILGVVVYFVLRDRPEQVNWLTPAEKASLRDRLDNEPQAVKSASHGSMWQLIHDPKVYSLALVYFLFIGVTYGMIFWTPTLVKSWGVQDLLVIGILTSIPSIFGIIGMVLIGRSSDKHMERRMHFFGACAIGALGVAITLYTQGNLIGSLVGLCLMTIGQASQTPLFFTAISEYLPRKTAAGGIALISSLGNLGPAVMPLTMTWVTTTTGSQTSSLYIVMGMWLASGFLLLALMRPGAVGHPRLVSA